MQLTNKDLIKSLESLHLQLKETMKTADLPEWDSQELFEYMLNCFLDGSEFTELVEDPKRVAKELDDMNEPDAEQDYDGQWYLVS